MSQTQTQTQDQRKTQWSDLIADQVVKEFKTSDWITSKRCNLNLPIAIIDGIKIRSCKVHINHINHNKHCNFLTFLITVVIQNNHKLQSHIHDDLSSGIPYYQEYNIHFERSKVKNNDKSKFLEKILKCVMKIYDIMDTIRFSKLSDRLTTQNIDSEENVYSWINICKALPKCVSEYDTCSVCLDETTTFTTCGHYLCRHCSQQLKTDTCPVCRKFLLHDSDDDYGYDENDDNDSDEEGNSEEEDEVENEEHYYEGEDEDEGDVDEGENVEEEI